MWQVQGTGSGTREMVGTQAGCCPWLPWPEGSEFLFDA